MVKEDLIQDIQKKRANIAVIGLGYVGLPLAVTFALSLIHISEPTRPY